MFPCKDCAYRTPECHISCERYHAKKREVADKKAKNRLESEWAVYNVQACIRICKKKHITKSKKGRKENP